MIPKFSKLANRRNNFQMHEKIITQIREGGEIGEGKGKNILWALSGEHEAETQVVKLDTQSVDDKAPIKQSTYQPGRKENC